MGVASLLARARSGRVPLDALALLLLLNLAIGTAGWLYAVNFTATVVRDSRDQLEAIATLKISQLDSWRSERLQDAWTFFENTILSQAVIGFIRQPDSSGRRADLEPILEAVTRRAQYSSITVIAAGGAPLLSIPQTAAPLGPKALRTASVLAGEKAPALSDPFLDTDGRVHLLVVSPILDPSTGAFLGAVAIGMDPAESLYPIVSGWPVPSSTAEALIVRERDRRVLFLSPLRFRSSTALLSIAATEQDSLVGYKAVRGLQGPTKGRDYRGEPVYATVRRISGLPWFLVVKVDQQEVAAEARRVSRAVLAGLVIIALLLSAWVIVRWSQQAARSAAEQERLRSRLLKARELESVALLAGGVAHDFNNALAGIGGMAEVLRGRIADPGLRQHAQKIIEATGKAASVVQGLLSFSEQQRLRGQPLELNGLVRAQREPLAAVLGPRISLVIEPAAEEIPILGDRDLLADVLRHLAENAREAMPLGGTCTITIEKPHAAGEADSGAGDPGVPAACLRVRDTGVGMDAETQNRIFEPFFTTKEFGSGAGIGLAAVYGIVRQHGGAIDVESAPGKGATFTLRFPLLRP